MNPNYNSDYDIRLAELSALGGDTTQCYDSVYEIDLAILEKIQGGGISQQVINDNVTSTSTTYSSSKIVQLLADAGFKTAFVDELPATGDIHTIYFVPSTNPATQNAKDEFMWTGSAWEQVGSTTVDLSNYYTKSEVDEKINTISNTANAAYENASTIDFIFSEPYEGAEVGAKIVYNVGSQQEIFEYKGEELGWEQLEWDGSSLYFDTANSVLYAYNTEAGELLEVTIPNTIVVSNLNTDVKLKAIKTPGTYNVIQHLVNATRGSYVKNWVMTVTSIDYDDESYETGDKWYQTLVNNVTIQKRSWSATRQSNDGWSNFSTYYTGEIKDTTTSKYYTWSSDKLNSLYEMPQDMFRLISRQNGSTIYINNAHTAFATSSYKYSFDGVTWNILSDTAITVNLNKVIYIKGIAGQATTSSSNTAFFITTGNFDAYGNLGWLYDVSNPNVSIYKEKTLIGLFKDAVISNMDVWCNVKKLENYALTGMFKGSHITSSVKFNNTLECRRATYWYRDCTSLVNAYPLYIENFCESMVHLYNGCTALRNVYVECDYCLSVGNMFSNCTALENIYFVVHYYTYATYGASSFAANVPTTCNVHLTDYAQYVLNNTTLTLTKDISTTKIYDKDIQVRKGSEYFLMSANITYFDDRNKFYFPTLKPTDNITHWNYLLSHTYLYIQETPIEGGAVICRFTICYIDAQTIKAMGYLNGNFGIYECTYDSATDTMTHTFTPIS